MVLFLMVKIIIWIFLKIVRLCYIPLDIINTFLKPKFSPPITDSLLLIPANELVAKIRERQITSESVVQAYIKRIKEVNPILNAVIQDRFEDALKEAKKIEEILNESKSEEELKSRYPLLGLPISIKGSLAVKGLSHCSGVIIKKNRIAWSDARTVERVKNAGAIPLLVSNTPEFCLNWETTNKLIGTTNNPYDTRKTVGGSSGGEAALISSGASLFGIGSDIAGSLRIPMHYCGIWGHKPTPRLISIEGHYPSCPKEEWPDVFNVGPIARYSRDLAMLFDVLIEPEEKIKLKKPPATKNIKVFYIKQLKSFLTNSPSLSTLKAIDMTVQYFDSVCKNKCTPLSIATLNEASALSYYRLLNVDDIETTFGGKGEGAHFELLKYVFCLSQSVFTTIGYGILRWWYQIFPNSIKRKVFKEIDKIRDELIDTLGNDGVLIMPVVPNEATAHGSILKQLFDYGYCSIVNSLHFPSTACPVLKSNEGLPVGLQVIGAPYSDLLCLQVAQEIEMAFEGWKPPPWSI